MKSKHKGKSKSKGRGMTLRIAQKQSMRHVAVGVSLISVMIGGFIYFNFFNSGSSKAESGQTAFRPTYTGTEMNVPIRLLLKPDAASRMQASSDFKNDTAAVMMRISRGQTIAAGRYIVD